jgi:hypothetical protein
MGRLPLILISSLSGFDCYEGCSGATLGFMPPLPLYHQLPHLASCAYSPLVRVTASARTAHLYVIGMSGKGTSKLLEWCVISRFEEELSHDH